MKSSKKERSLKDFISHNNQYSHTRLISLVGSLIVFIMFILNPLNDGLQNIVLGILAASLTNATISKFSNESKQTEYGYESTSTEEVWTSESEQSEPDTVGRSNRTRNTACSTATASN
jgi:hypothetical protein